jgi:hypothetical protein
MNEGMHASLAPQTQMLRLTVPRPEVLARLAPQ